MHAIICYTVKPDKTEENLRLVEAVCAEFNETKPPGFCYAAFVSDDGLTFFHLPVIEGEDPLEHSVAFKAFKKDIGERYDEVPVPLAVKEVGSYNFHVREANP